MPGSDHQSIAKKTSTNLKSSSYSLTVSRESGGYPPPCGEEKSSPRTALTGAGSVSKQSHNQLKRSSSFSTSGIQKKHKMASLRDVTLADAAKYASLSDYGFFDKVSQESDLTKIPFSVSCP